MARSIAAPCIDTCLVGRVRRFVYAYVPKAACTSLKLWMATIEGLLPADWTGSVPGGVHALLKPQNSLAALPRKHAEAILGNPSWFKFAFVRNPLSRLVSAYLDKVVPAKPTAAGLIRGYQMRDSSAPWWRRLTACVRIDAERSLTFRQLVDQLARERPEQLDEHFRPQSLLLAGLPLDFVGRVENMAQDLAVVQRRLDTNVALSHKKQHTYAAEEGGEFVAHWPAESFRRNTVHPHWRRFFPADVLRAVTEIYLDDFLQFGYEASTESSVSRPLRRAA